MSQALIMTVRPHVPRPVIVTARAEALFVSDLSATEPHDAAELAVAIAVTIRAYGVRGCAERMAVAYGDHPEQAALRMRWARAALEVTA